MGFFELDEGKQALIVFGSLVGIVILFLLYYFLIDVLGKFKDYCYQNIKLFKPNIGKMKERKDVKGLIKALQYKEPDVRVRAAEALGEIGDPLAVNHLITTFRFDKDNSVQAAAKNALVKIGVPSVIPLFKLFVNFTDYNLQAVVTKLILEIGDRAVEPLIVEVNDYYGHHGDDAARFLGKIGDARAISPLSAVLGNYNRHVSVREAAAKALGKLNAVESLIKALEHCCDGCECEAIAYALGKIGTPATVV